MKRSEINQILREANEFARAHQFYLPPFAYWSPEEWRQKGPEAAEIVHNQLGWDITDFGSNDFEHTGLFLFTLRNGHPSNWQKKQGKLYAEKLLIVRVGQVTPMHYHWAKMEDIINRGGGRLLIQLYNADVDDNLDETTPVNVSMDGVVRTFPAGTVVELKTGESISLTPGLYHKFWGAEGTVLVGEVSLVNDDNTDNNFHPPVGRFPNIEEDEEPVYLLVKDYSRYYRHG